MMDAPGNRYEDLALALRDIGRVNRWLGGSAAIMRPIERIVDRHGLCEFSLLDVGTGGGDVPRAVLARAERRGLLAHAVGIDLDANVVRYAASRCGKPASGCASVSRLALLRADAFALPFRTGAFDFVTSSLFLHHFSEADAARLLAECARVSRQAVLVNDLARHFVPWAAIKALGLLFAKSPMFRNDAPLSVLRGWTAEELLTIAADAGLARGARVLSLRPYRLVLLIERSAAA